MERKRDTNTTQLGTKYCRMERKGFYVFLLDIVLLFSFVFVKVKEQAKHCFTSFYVSCLSLFFSCLSFHLSHLSLFVFPSRPCVCHFLTGGPCDKQKKEKEKEKSKSCISNGFRRSNQRARSICSWFRFFSLLCFRFLLSAFSR
jgi:hypothetical protein